MTRLFRSIESKEARICVIGAGYVGLPLAVTFAEAGFAVTAYDQDASRVQRLNEAKSYIPDVSSARLDSVVSCGKLRASGDSDILQLADVILICVPTPLNKTREPDIANIVTATEQIAKRRAADFLVVLESTTYPGTTREVLVPALSRAGFSIGRDVFVGYSPERVDPGNREFGIENTPKVVAGVTPGCLELVIELYSSIVTQVVPVSSTETAETVKLLENTFRAVNIALANEFAIIASKLDVDLIEVIRAAATKPFGFMPFYPGPGLGGHCAPVDPLYLSWKLKSFDYDAQFISLADRINSQMPKYVVQRLADCLNETSRSLKGAKILIYGVSYKENVVDTRESPAVPVISQLRERGSEIFIMDPHVRSLIVDGVHFESIGQEIGFENFDAVMILAHHRELPVARLLHEAHLILDTRGGISDSFRTFPKVRRL